MTGSHPLLPARFRAWFRRKGWHPHRHQLEVLRAIRHDREVLVIAPTGGGKTLCGFLPGLIDLTRPNLPDSGLRVLYLSPLKALTADVHRNLQVPLMEMQLPLSCDIRTGDTPSHVRTRQRKNPPSILLTTPESLALMNAGPEADSLFANLDYLILDELHALADNKRGDLLSLNVARIRNICPQVKTIGLSATVAEPSELASYLSPKTDNPARIINAYQSTALQQSPPEVELIQTGERLPWSGHSGRYALPEVMDRILRHQLTIVFVNTRAQAEFTFQDLQELNETRIPIALHHGSLDREARLEVEAGMAEGRYRAVVATSSLDLGIDWGDIDLVIQIGPPKGVARLMQRIGRSNHRLDTPSQALLVPTNRMETLEAVAAIEAIAENDLDNHYHRTGSLDVLFQHMISSCCRGPILADDLLQEIRTAAPYRNLDRNTFHRAVDFISSGGYALRAYDQFKKILQSPTGELRLAHPRLARIHKMNIGTIVGYTHLKVRLGRSRNLGEVEERFVQGLVPGDTFLFAGQLLKFTGIRETTVRVEPGGEGPPKVPAFAGGKLPLSGPLARRVRQRIAQPGNWNDLSAPVREWLEWQRSRSGIPAENEILVESFPRGGIEFLVAHPFAGKNAHHTLGMLLTLRMEEEGLQPLGFVSTDYSLAVWSLKPVLSAGQAEPLFHPDILEQPLQNWMESSALMKRTFRETAIIAGLIDRQLPGKRKSGRQVTFSSDVIYDVLRQYEPDHLLLEATRNEAARGLVQSERLRSVLEQARGHLNFVRLDRISPFAIPVVLEVGKETVDGAAVGALLEMEAEQLVKECAG